MYKNNKNHSQIRILELGFRIWGISIRLFIETCVGVFYSVDIKL